MRLLQKNAMLTPIVYDIPSDSLLQNAINQIFLTFDE